MKLRLLWKTAPGVIFLITWQHFITFGAWEKQCDPYALPY